MTVTVFAETSPHTSDELRDALDIEGLAKFLAQPFVFVPEATPTRPERREYRERNERRRWPH